MGVRRTSTLTSASGVWDLNDQIIEKRENVWPIMLGSISDYFPILWYDFADETKVTVSSSEITEVTDQGSLGLNLTKLTTGPAYTTGINGLKCVNWGGGGHNNYLRNTTPIANIGEIYIVFNTNGFGIPLFAGLVSSPFDSFYVTWVGNFATGNFLVTFENGALAPNNTYSGSTALVRITRPDNTSFSSLGFQIGNDRSIGGRGWPGFIGEVAVFASPLGSIQRNNVQTILSTKWNIPLVP
jgi:hypothetical protein